MIKPAPLSQDSAILLEEIDTNCNACKHFKRDLEWAKQQREKYGVNKLSWSVGECTNPLIDEQIKIPNGVCMPENGVCGKNCWESRRK